MAFLNMLNILNGTSCVSQLVTCLTSDMCLTADLGVPSLILAQYHNSLEIDHEITAILLPSADARRVFVSYKRKYVHEVLVNCLVKLAQEKVWLGELTVST